MQFFTNKHMIVSVIIPTLNSCRDLENCINSILCQTYPEKEIEIIVIDGGSTDDTLIYLSRITGNIKYVSEPDNGIYDAMNKGINLANGKWILFMGDDDKLANNDVFSSIFNNTNFNSSVSIIYGSGICNGLILFNSFGRKILKGNSLNHQCAFYHHTIFTEIKYDAKYKIGADYKLNLLLYRARYEAVKVPFFISEYGGKGISYHNVKLARLEENLARVEVLGIFIGTILNALVRIKYFLKDNIK
ncbi:MAG: glycosyltransferase [Cyanobacteria bacterium REEB459]|nr:glycosyltransferase [Cyanobacteria bacterium REEB459]